MKAKELRDLTVKELKDKLANMEEEIYNLRFQSTMGQLANPLRLRIIRKDIARVHTLMHQKELAAKSEN